ncbi:hypothetical protein DD571_31975, partial [Klebsiella pneumoniae]
MASGKTATPSALLAFHNPSKDFTTLELKKKAFAVFIMRHQKKIFSWKAHQRVHTQNGAHYLLNGALKQTCLPKKAQFAFKDSMVHKVLQFTLLIAFRYVLHL